MHEEAYKRLAKIFPMLSSNADGEIVNAARAMSKVLTDAKLHWTDVAKRIVDGAPPWEGTDRTKEAPKREHPFEGRQGFRQQQERPREDNGPRRKPSAWAQDSADVKKAMPYRGQLDDWSEEFLESIEDQVVHQGRKLTERQRDKLNEILDKLGLT